MLKNYLIILLLLVTAKASSQFNESIVKSAMIFNLLEYIDWQEEPVYLGMYTDDTVKINELRKLSKNSVSNTKVLAINIKEPHRIESLNAIYIDEKFNEEIPFIYNKLSDSKTLVITDNYNEPLFYMINLYKKNEKLSFSINRKNLEDKGFNYSTDILIHGGTFTDLKEVYLETYKQLNKNKKQVKELKDYSKQLIDSTNAYKNLNKNLTYRIDSLEENIKERENRLKKLEENIEERKNNLSQQMREIKKQQNLQKELREEVRSYKNTINKSEQELLDLNKIIEQKQTEITGQNKLLKRKNTEIESQRRTILLSIISLILLVFAVISSLWAYVTKRKTSRYLETEVDKRTKELSASEANFKSLVQNIPDYIIRYNEEFKVTFMNKNLYNLFHPDNQTEVNSTGAEEIIKKSLVSEVINSDNPIHKEITYKIKNKRIILDWVLVPIKDNSGKLHSVLGVSRDISTLKKIQDELKEAKEKAEKSDHLKSAFLANMSHEIRTPLNAILGFSNLLKNASFSEEEKNEYIEIIREKGYHLLKLIDDIIDISKIEAGYMDVDFKETDLNTLLNNTYKVFSEELAKNNKQDDIELILENKKFESNNSKIITDESRLRQVIFNLLSNATKFTEKGHIKFGCKKEMNTLLFFVEDTGIGIESEKQPYVFNRFMQVFEGKDKLYGGTGLGLSISQKIVEMLGGKIWLNSKMNKGTTFSFTIPYKTNNEDNQTINKSNKIYSKDFKGKEIMIVDDERSNSLYLKKIIELTNAHPVIANNGNECLNYLRNNNKVDLILLDIKMPKPNGYEVVELIKNNYPKIPVIAQTAYAMSEDKNKALNSGFDDYLSKPISEDELLNVISKHLLKIIEN